MWVSSCSRIGQLDVERVTKQSMCEDLAGSSVGNHSACQLLELDQGGPR